MGRSRTRVGPVAVALVVTGVLAGSCSSSGETVVGGATPLPVTPASVAPVDVTIAATGDVLPHAAVNDSARRAAGGDGYDYRPSFARIAPDISAADVGLCHLETPLSPDHTGLTQPGIKVFNTPHEMADALHDAGYDGCDVASNHTWDQGLQGIADTRDVMRAAGLQYAGTSPTASERGVVGWYEVGGEGDTGGGVRVAQLAYSYTAANRGEPSAEVPADAPWSGASLWPARGAGGIRDDARAARDEGADLVVVSMHWGAEYVTEPTDDQRSIARALLRSDDVDLVLGTHVHVVQPCERIDGKYVFYGLGNSLSNQSPQTASDLRPETQEGVLVRLQLTKGDDGTVRTTARYQPTRVELDGHVIEPATPEHHPETYERVTATLGSLGDDSCPIAPLRP